ncbi:MAG: restriction endonuclease subunit S [Nitrospirota bacterium]
MGEWKEYKIKDLGLVVTGKTPSSTFPEEFGSEMPFVTPTDFRNYRKLASFAERNLSAKGIEKLRNKVLPPSSILVTCIGSDMGKIVMNRVPVITNQQINAIIPNQELVSPDFLYYMLVDCYETLRMYSQAGTAVPILNKGDFEEINLTIPSDLSEQKTIASILSSLDDKIDLLRRQNKTLEALAETLFRQWFVEEAEGENVKLGDAVKTSSGGTPSRSKMEYYSNGTIKWVKSKELQGSFIFETEEKVTDDAVKNSSAKLFPANTILIAMYGATVGEYGILAEPATCNQAICALLPNENYPYTFLFILTKFNKENLINMAGGSAQQNISQELIQELEIPKSTDRIKEFHNETEPMFLKIKLNTTQIHTLIRLRDTLLPKLMSGEVRVRYENN